ncbi:MAG: hypothetical protein WCX91_05800, partial [Candidatus Omnitrophota bacterium]
DFIQWLSQLLLIGFRRLKEPALALFRILRITIAFDHGSKTGAFSAINRLIIFALAAFHL